MSTSDTTAAAMGATSMNATATQAPEWIARARAEGLAPPDDDAPPRPWPVVVLTALGAWLAVPPFLILFFVMFGQAFERGPMPYIEGVGLSAVAVVLLRSRGMPLFLEQVAVPLLLTGLASLGYALVRDLPAVAVELIGLLIAAGLIVLLQASWLRVLLGLAAALLTGALFSDLLMSDPGSFWRRMDEPGWGAVWLVLGAGISLLAWQHRIGGTARGAAVAAALEPVLAGWWVALLGVLVLLSGRSWAALGTMPLVDAAVGGDRALSSWMPLYTAMGASALLALAAGARLAMRWAWARSWRLLPLLLLLTGLAALMPSLGGCLLVLALMLESRRHRLAALAAAAALWVLGSFYYELHWRLADKALVLVVAGVLLAVWTRWIAWRPAATFASPDAPDASAAPVDESARRERLLAIGLLGLAGVAALLTVDYSIARKQRLIAKGRPVYVKLAPVDPRSLMQGDFMRLSYDLPGVGWRGRGDAEPPMLWGARPRVAVTLDAQGVAQEPKLLAPGEAAPPGTLVLTLTPKDGGWTFVSDAWFFKEGEAARWQAAKYGEFRVDEDGRALLVGVVGEGLRPL
ncbi:GDYXXLXY domain-containing protein [Roseateles sp.]|uniref:GDYXXLXY domain-containing protein n=1 Tax=Roseateles sp. TaxID=1971397 RepID=UPI0031E31601